MREADCDTVGLSRSGSFMAERASAACPGPEATRHETADHAADVAPLSDRIGWTRIVARNRHGPVAFARAQFLEKARSVVNVPGRIEHRLNAGKLVSVISMINLHATKVDQPGALVFCVREPGHGVTKIRGQYRPSINVERIGVQDALAPGLAEADRIQHAERDAVPACRKRHLTLAGPVRARSRRHATNRERRQSYCAQPPAPDVAPPVP